MDQLSFTKEHCIDKNGKWNPTRNLMALFEHYSFHAFAFAIDPTANRSVHIATFAVVDAAGDFVVRSRDAAAANKFTHDSGDGFMTTAMEVESRVLRVDFELSAIAKMAAICPFLVNWALTIGSIYVTTLMTLGKLEANGTVAVLPFGALLIIMAVRFFSSRPLGTTTGKFLNIIMSVILFRGLMHSSRRGGSFRTDCHDRVVFSGIFESPHSEIRLSVVIPNKFFCLDQGSRLHT